MSNLTLVLPPDKQYYVAYFIVSNSINAGFTNMYKSNITTAFENTWVDNADLYNFWLENKNPGSKVNGTTYTIPDDLYYSGNSLNYAIISWKKEDNTYEYVVWAFLASRFNSKYSNDSNIITKKDNDGNILVYINFIKNGVLHLYAPGKKLNDYELGINDLIELESSETILCTNNMHIFPMDVRIDGYVINEISNGIIGEGEQAENIPKITPMYNVTDGSIPESKAIELVGGIIKPFFGAENYPKKDTYTPINSTSYHALYSIRCKFTKLNEKKILSNGEAFPYRLLKFGTPRSAFGFISANNEWYIDKNNNKLIITGDRIEINLPDDFNIYDWHEWAFWHESNLYKISHIYLDGNLLWNGFTLDQSALGWGKIGWVCGIPFPLGSVSQSMVIDQIKSEVKSDPKPYEMTLTDTFNYYPIPEPEPIEPEPEEPTGIINKNIYLVCYKGATSIFDKLIRIIKTNLTSKEFPPPPIDPRLRHLVGRLPPPLKGTFIPPLAKPEHILNALPKSYPIHMSPRPIEVLLSRILNSDYTHVGLWVVPENIPIPKEITYYACREDAGVMEYTEAYTDVDLYKINMPTVKPYHVKKFFEKTRYMRGSMIGDMGYRHLMHEHSMSSVEWVAAALNLAFPCKYTINKLIDFANLEE